MQACTSSASRLYKLMRINNYSEYVVSLSVLSCCRQKGCIAIIWGIWWGRVDYTITKGRTSQYSQEPHAAGMQAPSYVNPVATAYGTGQGVEVLGMLTTVRPTRWN